MIIALNFATIVRLQPDSLGVKVANWWDEGIF